MAKFYFLLCLMTSQHCKLTSVIPVMHHLQSNMFVGLKMQGISRLAYLCIFCHMAFFFPLVEKLLQSILLKHSM